MNISWKNTRKALQDFATILKCNKCGNKPLAATRYNTCGHFFCKNCIGSNSRCIKCGTPVCPTDIQSDHMVANLVHYCNVIADTLQEGSLWNMTTNTFEAPEISQIVQKPQFKTVNKRLPPVPKKNINKRNPKGETPLHTACLKEQEDLIKNLLDAGANANTKDNANWTPLQEVVNLGYTNICRLLLQAGASPNIHGVDNKTALHEAAINNRIAEAELLLQYSANKNVYDQYGKKPIDYAESEEMRRILMENDDDFHSTPEKVPDHNTTLDQSFLTCQSNFVIFPSNLKEENSKLLSKIAQKHKIKITSSFRSYVTHVLVEANNQNIVNLSYNVMVAIVRGNWLLNSEWVSLAVDLDDISTMDLEVFEVNGVPTLGTPKKARLNAQNQNPGLFDNCHFYFAMHPKNTYFIDAMRLTKDTLIRLVAEGGGINLTREPDPEDIKNAKEIIPFHTGHDSSHSLHKCTYYIIYVPGRDEPRLKYNMPHIKTLPLMWLIECIEKFTLIDPSLLGLI